MTKIVDNKNEKLANLLVRELADSGEIAIASAYFNVHGYGSIKAALGDRPLMFLLGRGPTESKAWEEEVLEELEREEDELEYFNLLQEAIGYFENPKRQVHKVSGPFFHGKAYIGASPSLQQINHGIGVVGSSNFTYGGLVYNRELNMVNTDREVVQELAGWFMEMWGSSEDFKETFISFLKNYVTTRSPYEVIAKALYETYKGEFDISAQVQDVIATMYPHQKLSARSALPIIQKYGGVLIADSTGLGKSRVALSIAMNAIRNGRKVMLIAPKSVLDTTWQDEMKKNSIFLESESSEKLSQDPDSVIEKYKDKDFIIVDEAHYFRTPSTIRYSALRQLVLKNKAQVVLATATPVNNSIMDLYNLFSFYLSEDSISDIYNGTLKGYFTENQKKLMNGQRVDMDEVLQRFMVRHSRRFAKELDTEGRMSTPERRIDSDPRNRYSMEIRFQEIYDLLNGMNFAHYGLSIDRLSEKLKYPDGTPVPSELEQSKKDKLKALVKMIVIINMFKRLESSLKAFSDTIQSVKDYMDNAAKYAEEYGYFVPASMRDEPLFDFDELMPTPDELFGKPKYAALKEKCKLTSEEVKDFVSKCEHDIAIIEQVFSKLPDEDVKFEAFRSRVRELVNELKNKEGNGLIVFTQYTATAKYIYKMLRESIGNYPVRLVTGELSMDENGNTKKKNDVIRLFMNGGGILVSTDVLSEGQNLQNAQYVANYDFPWNPVMLIQRIGRIDRIGSLHREVFLINILPKNGDPEDPATLEHFLNLMRKLFMRLEGIRQTVGIDASTLGEEAMPKDFGSFQEGLARNDISELNRLASELEEFTIDPIDTLAKIMKEKSLQWLKELPDGIGAYKHGNRDGLFILFTDGNSFYWRLRYFDGDNETTSSANSIIQAIMEGETDNRGEMIDYSRLIERMKLMKKELLDELESRRKKALTNEGMPARSTKTIQEIYNSLASSGDEGEKLASIFRDNSSRATLVRELGLAKQSGNLLEKARELLSETTITNNHEMEKPIKLKRVSWCWIQPKDK